MDQIAVHRNPNRATRSTIPLLLDIRNNLPEELGTRVVIPLYKPAAVEGGVIDRLTPRFEINGAMYVAVTSELAGVPQKALGPPVADLAHLHEEIVAALDFLVTGI